MRILSEILKKISDHEKKILNEHKIKHGPTIGKMYEGLTKHVLDLSNLDKYGLKVVSGFMCAGKDISGQIDCMVVFGDGAAIPMTDDFIYPINQVLAVIVVKKNLATKEMAEAYTHLNDALRLSKIDYSLRHDANTLKFKNKFAAQEYTCLFGEEAPRHEEEFRRLSFHKRAIYKTLIRESFTPARIAIGYNGYKSEEGLRRSIKNLYEKKALVKGYGVTNMPNLIISDGYSIVKTTGFPYKGYWHDERGWGWLASSSSNPILLMLEILYYRIELALNTTIDRGADDNEEILYSLATASPVEMEQGFAWNYQINMSALPKNEVRNAEWTPLAISIDQKDLVTLLHEHGKLLTNDSILIDFMTQRGIQDLKIFILPLLNENILLIGNGVLSFGPAEVAITELADKWYCGNNAGGRFEKWIARSVRAAKEG